MTKGCVTWRRTHTGGGRRKAASACYAIEEWMERRAGSFQRLKTGEVSMKDGDAVWWNSVALLEQTHSLPFYLWFRAKNEMPASGWCKRAPFTWVQRLLPLTLELVFLSFAAKGRHWSAITWSRDYSLIQARRGCKRVMLQLIRNAAANNGKRQQRPSSTTRTCDLLISKTLLKANKAFPRCVFRHI